MSRVVLPLATVATVALGALFWQGKNRELIWLGMIAGIAFAAQVFLKRMGRTTRVVAEVVGALALTSMRPPHTARLGWFDARRGTVVGQLAVCCRPDPLCVAPNSRSASGGTDREIRVGLEFRGWADFAHQHVGPGVAFQLVSRIDVDRLCPDFVSWLRVVCEKAPPIVVRRLGWTEMAHAVAFGVLLTASFCFAPLRLIESVTVTSECATVHVDDSHPSLHL